MTGSENATECMHACIGHLLSTFDSVVHVCPHTTTATHGPHTSTHTRGRARTHLCYCVSTSTNHRHITHAPHARRVEAFRGPRGCYYFWLWWEPCRDCRVAGKRICREQPLIHPLVWKLMKIWMWFECVCTSDVDSHLNVYLHGLCVYVCVCVWGFFFKKTPPFFNFYMCFHGFEN